MRHHRLDRVTGTTRVPGSGQVRRLWSMLSRILQAHQERPVSCGTRRLGRSRHCSLAFSRTGDRPAGRIAPDDLPGSGGFALPPATPDGAPIKAIGCRVPALALHQLPGTSRSGVGTPLSAADFRRASSYMPKWSMWLAVQNEARQLPMPHQVIVLAGSASAERHPAGVGDLDPEILKLSRTSTGQRRGSRDGSSTALGATKPVGATDQGQFRHIG